MMQQIGPEHRNLLTRYSDIRKRLMGSPKRQQVQKLIEEKVEAKPLWKTSQIRLDYHTREYQQIMKQEGMFGGMTVIEYMKFWCQKENESYADLIGKSRFQDHVKSRQKLWVDLASRGLSLTKIAQFFDRDHTTILHGILKIDPNNEAKRFTIKKWQLTEAEELRIVNSFKEIGNGKYVARYFSMSQTKLTEILEKHGIARKSGSTTVDRFDVFYPEQGKLITSLYEAGHSLMSIAGEIDTNHETIRQYIKAKGVVKGIPIHMQKAG